MKWNEIDIIASSSMIDDIELLLIKSEVSGWQVVDIDDNPELMIVRFYISDNNTDKLIIEAVETGIEELNSKKSKKNYVPITISQTLVDDENWLDVWKEYFKPIEIGQDIVIKPVWAKYNIPEKIIMEIEPGNVFGTGQHETTRLCIEALERYIKPGDVIMDIGCGSGILSIISLMLGADYCVAVDFNTDVPEAVYQNARLNRISIDKLDMRVGDVFNSPHLLMPVIPSYKHVIHGFDCIVANIVADAIINLTPLIIDMECLKPDGLFIASGIMNDSVDSVISTLKTADFNVINVDVLGDWSCVVGVPQQTR